MNPSCHSVCAVSAYNPSSCSAPMLYTCASLGRPFRHGLSSLSLTNCPPILRSNDKCTMENTDNLRSSKSGFTLILIRLARAECQRKFRLATSQHISGGRPVLFMGNFNEFHIEDLRYICVIKRKAQTSVSIHRHQHYEIAINALKHSILWNRKQSGPNDLLVFRSSYLW